MSGASSAPTPIILPMTTWNRARGVWETPRSALCGHSELFSETWPTSGTTRAGKAYARPTSAPRTSGSEFSSSPGLLPTPLTTTATGVQELERRVGGRGSLLPTPTVSDTNGAGAHGTGGLDLRTALALLPTPTATPYGNNQSPSPGAAVRPSLNSLAPLLLPTPTTTNAHGNGRNSRGELLLPGVVLELLPTPTRADGERTSVTYARGNPTLTGALTHLPSGDGNDT